jgi:2-hydroxycyclohexanecarboxyl-CoA dehydrogenase
MTENVFSNKVFLETVLKEYPLNRLGTAEDIAEAVSWLSTDECFLTGQNIQVNGGLTLRRCARFEADA